MLDPLLWLWGAEVIEIHPTKYTHSSRFAVFWDVCIMTSYNGNASRVCDPLWGEPPVIGGFQKAGIADFDVFFDVSLNK